MAVPAMIWHGMTVRSPFYGPDGGALWYTKWQARDPDKVKRNWVLNTKSLGWFYSGGIVRKNHNLLDHFVALHNLKPWYT